MCLSFFSCFIVPTALERVNVTVSFQDMLSVNVLFEFDVSACVDYLCMFNVCD